MNNSFLMLVICALMLVLVNSVEAQHLADAEFNTAVAKPAYAKKGPRILFDEGHYNYHTLADRFKPFADLLTNDGYSVIRNRQPFTKKSLDSFKVLIIVNALADDIDEAGADKQAFPDEEIAVVRDWVKGGGSLLLVVDAGPFASASQALATQFGVEMSGKFVKDASNSESDGRSDLIVYSRENHLLGTHPITQGRGVEESLKRVITFSGQSLKGPDSAVSFLKLSDSAVEAGESAGADGAPPLKSSAGRSQGIALKFGNGRVVVLAEAEMLSALLGEPPDKEPIGMNYPDTDNKQFTLNLMHWLSGLLSER